MKTERFTWDESKRLSNFLKHGLDFEDAVKVFQGSYVSYIDNRYFYDETRCIAVGFFEDQLVSISYTERAYETRIISFRRASRKEEKLFGNNFPD